MIGGPYMCRCVLNVKLEERNLMKSLAHTRGCWMLGMRSATYSASGESAKRLLAEGIPLEFEAISIGSQEGKQIAIIPLDESSVENARLMALAPEMYRMLKSVREWLRDEDKIMRVAIDSVIKRVEGEDHGNGKEQK